jgi:F0F1-type ATP synthase membrane subunit b/b'
MNTLFLQIFLIITVFLAGILATIAAYHALAHFRPHPEEKKPHPVDQTVHLPADVRQKLLGVAQSNFQKVLDHSASELETDLKSTAEKLISQLDKLGVELVTSEMQRYKASLETLRMQTEETVAGGNADIAAHQTDIKAKLSARQTELEAKLNEEITAEKQRLLDQIDTKLGDAVASFLIETLQHNVDLGSQSAYLTSMLEEHKADFAKEINDEA